MLEEMENNNDATLKELIIEEYEKLSNKKSSSNQTMLVNYVPKGCHPKHLRILKKALELLPTRGVYLDVCVGLGVAARILSQKGYKVYVIESEEIAGPWKQKFDDTTIELIDIRIEDQPIPLPDESVDFVYFGATLEHIHNSPRPILLEFKRVLRPGGILFVDVPNFLCLRHRVLMLLGINVLPSIEYIYHCDFHAEHHREYTLSEARDIFRWSGYELIESYYDDIVFHRTLVTRGKLAHKRGKGSDFYRSQSVWDYDLPFNPLNWFDWVKLFVRPVLTLFHKLRDDIVAIGRKPV